LTNLFVTSLAIDPDTPTTIYAGTDGGGVFKSTNGGGNWTAMNPAELTNLFVTSLAIDPDTPTTIYAGTDGGGVFKSINGGSNWTDISTGLPILDVTSLAIDPDTPTTIYAGTYGGGVFNSIGGGNWTAMNTGLTNTNVTSLAIDPITPLIMYAGTLGSVYDFQVPPAVYPDPMTWATEPYVLTSTSISMVATVATANVNPPYYYFDFVDSPTTGTGGSDSVWQLSTSYTDSVLQPNHRYGYLVRARDSATTPNVTSYSTTVYKYTLANVPGTAAFSNITQSSIQAGWTANENRSGTVYYCENTTQGTNSGWTTSTSWNSTGLDCSTSYAFRVKARNGDGFETGWTSLGSQSTTACPLLNYTLTVNKAGTGSGTVTSNPSGIDCGGTCSASFSSGTLVTLNPAAATGSTFAGWSGDSDCTDGVVTMPTSRNCTATFTPNYTLTVNKAGTGSGTVTSNPSGINCGGDCSETYNYNTSVTLTATADTVSTFTGWSGGGCSGTGTCNVTMNDNKSVTAQFTPVKFPVYRFYNFLKGTHFYTIWEAEKDYAIAHYTDMIYEGIAFYVYPVQQTGTLPVYRFYNFAKGTHFYTISESEKNYAIANYTDMIFEGVAFYAFTGQQTDTLPVYRFYNFIKGTHFYTISESEKDYAIANYTDMVFEGVAYYAYPNP
jgi:hypothetical protein